MSDAQRVSFTVAGVPQQQGSKAPYGNGRLDANHKKLTPWRAAVELAAIEAWWGKPPMTGPVHLYVDFTFARPKSVKNSVGWKATRVDLDKLVRAVGDSLTAAGLVKDDGQIAWLTATKRFGTPGVRVLLLTLDEKEAL